MKLAGTVIKDDQLVTLGKRLHAKLSVKHLAIIAERGLLHRALHVPGNLVVRGDLVLDRAKVQVLFVDGDLTVKGCLQDRADEENESLICVGGDLRAHDVITFGTLEVHGDLIVRDHLLFLDNACAAQIDGDVTARFVFDEYHHVKIGGQLRAPIVAQDARGRIVSKRPFKSYELDSALAGVLVRQVLDGFKDADEPGGFYVDAVNTRALVSRVRRRKPILLAAASRRS